MKNSMICSRCLEGVVFNNDDTTEKPTFFNVAVNAIATDAVATVKQRLAMFTPSVCNFYVSLRNTNKRLSQKGRMVESAIAKMLENGCTDAEIRRAGRLFETIQFEWQAASYMLAFIETHCSDEVSIMVRNMSFREIEEILSK